MAENKHSVAPFLRVGLSKDGMMYAVLACLTLSALHFSIRYAPSFFMHYMLCILSGLAIEPAYHLLNNNRFTLPRPSTAVTAALLVMSIPASMPWHQVIWGLLVALLFGKFICGPTALRLNPMLLGRLFLMLLLPESIQTWLDPATEIDTFTAATPLGFYAAESVITAPKELLLGIFGGTWEDFYTLLPGSPGDLTPIITLVFGVILYFIGVIDWRPGLMYLLSFAATCWLLDLPVTFNLLAGSTFFTAVYIITDPKSTAATKSGRIACGLLAGTLNALIRNIGYYPEGVVFAILAANILSPTFDRIAFHLQSRKLA